MDYMTLKETSEKWGVSVRQITIIAPVVVFPAL